MPKVSVLLGVRDEEKYVAQSIRAVLDQTFQDFEIVVVDDGSTDGTAGILDQFAAADQRVKVCHLPSSMGIAYGCNQTIDQAQGEYLARLDGDDYWEPTKLEKQVAVLDADPETGTVATWVRLVDGQGRELTDQQSAGRLSHFNSKGQSQADWLRTLFFEKSRLNHPSMLTRASLMRQVKGYNFAYRQLPDYDVWIRLVKRAGLVMLDEPLVNYRWDGNNTSSFSVETMHRFYFELFDVLCHFFDDLDDQLFLDAFSHRLVRPELTDPRHLEIQKALLLYHYQPEAEIGKLAGLQKLYHLFNDPFQRKLLIEDFDITPGRLAEMTSLPLFADFVVDAQGQDAITALQGRQAQVGQLEGLLNYYQAISESYAADKASLTTQVSGLREESGRLRAELDSIKSSRWYRLLGSKKHL